MSTTASESTSASSSAGSSSSGSGNASAQGWSGLTIKEILEKVDLFNITLDEGEDPIKGEKVLVGKPAAGNKTSNDGRTVIDTTNPESAFLGPKLWENKISLDPILDETEFSIMNIDDFLNENNLTLEAEENSNGSSGNNNGEGPSGQQQLQQVDQDEKPDLSQVSAPEEILPPSNHHEMLPPPPQQPSTRALKRKLSSSSSSASPGPPPSNKINSAAILPKDSNTEFLYAESKRARMERERAEKRRRQQEAAAARAAAEAAEMEVQVDFAAEDLALATVPGADFDPRRRAFSADELRPQPIIRKRKKVRGNQSII